MDMKCWIWGGMCRRRRFWRPCGRENIRLVGLSALMTTTLPAMEETLQLLKTLSQPPVTMVGGAVVTPEYAKKMGADYYARDAGSPWRSQGRYWDNGYQKLLEVFGPAAAV